ncbi:(2Fe-2S)-binding protein [Actinomadura madurae]|nr:(2Fe-2S)-binding protein [Actinomadura madurae]
MHAAGEVTGIAGAPAAQAEGLLAGWTAGHGSPDAPAAVAARRRRDRARAFAARLAAAHPIGAAWPGWLRPDTIVCRCEDTPYGALPRAAGTNSAHAVKLATRAGLGPCQARICGPAVAELLRSGQPHHRPIAQPVRLGELARPPVEDPGTKESSP